MKKDLKTILADILQIAKKEITDQTSMKTVRLWDSLKHMELILALEQELNLRPLTMAEISRMTSVIEIKRVLRNRNIRV